MIKKLTKYGNSQALIIDKPILALMGIDEHVRLKITTDGQSLVITPIRSKKITSTKNTSKNIVQHALNESIKQHDQTMRKLARYRKS